jgi:hypothetical protein
MGKIPMKPFVFVVAMLLLPGMSIGAETVKLRHVRSVYADEKEVGLRFPQGVGCDGKAGIVVADSGNGRLVRFTLSDGKLTTDREIKVPELSVPIRVHINSKGEIFAFDGRRQRVVRLSPEGAFKGYVSAAGLPAPTTFIPRSFAIDRSDYIYLLDLFAQRVLILTPGGRYAKQIGFPEDYGFISDLTVDDKGNIYLVDSVKAMVFMAGKGAEKFSPLTESMKKTMKFPATITTDERGNIYLADRNGGVIFILGQDGSLKGEQSNMGWTEGLLHYPEQMYINENDEILIADRGNNRVQLFTIRR